LKPKDGWISVKLGLPIQSVPLQPGWQRYIREEVHGKDSEANFSPGMGD
jgi:hypothetical protein